MTSASGTLLNCPIVLHKLSIMLSPEFLVRIKVHDLLVNYCVAVHVFGSKVQPVQCNKRYEKTLGL